MYRRRRRPQREIAFGLDSFLDVIANVVGIIIRMILVVWVGARAYHSIQPSPPTVEPPPMAEQKFTDPLEGVVARQRKELERLEQEYRDLRRTAPAFEKERHAREQRLHAMRADRERLAAELALLSQQLAAENALGTKRQAALDGLKKRHAELQHELVRLEKTPADRKAVYYRAPVSRPVQAEELFFELRENRVTFIDIAALVADMSEDAERRIETLRRQWRFEGHSRAVGPFRLRYVVERHKGQFDILGREPDRFTPFKAGVRWQVEPLTPERGETLEQALEAASQFRQVVDHADPRQTVVTFWVYPDSFGLYRALRDYLHARDIEVAGRPLPFGASISAGPGGRASRGQ